MKYKAEKKAEEMGILWYNDYMDAEQYAAREKRDKEVRESNANYEGNLPERSTRTYSSSEDEIPSGEQVNLRSLF